MERLAAKKRKGILSRMPKESNEDILVDLKKAEIKSREEGKRKATAADAESVREELELANAQDKLDARKPAGKLKARPDIELEGLKSSTDIVQEAMQKPSNQKAFSEPKATTAEERADLEKKYGSFEGAKRAIAAEGARYREALQPKKGFEEDYDADVKFQEEEYGGGSIRREMELDEIRGEADPETGVREAALGEDAAEYDKQYAKLEKENPNLSETELQDAAIKAVRAKQATDAEDATKDFNTVDYGDEMENEVRRKRLEAEAAEKERKERQKSMVKKAIGTGKLKGDRITKTPDGTPIQEAARKYIESSYGPDKEASESKLARMRETADARRRNLLVDVGESESSGDLEFEPEESPEETIEETDRRVTQEVVSREPAISKVLPGPDSSVEERQQWARLRPSVKSEAMKNVVQPMTQRVDDMYESVDNASKFAANLSSYFRTVGSDPTTPEANIQSLTARSPYQYYKTLPLSVKRNLDLQALEAFEFFRKNNKDRGYPERSKTTAYRSAADTPEAKLRSRLESYKRILERRVRTGDYETSEALPGKFSKGQYLPIPLPGFETETPAYSKDVPLEAQEDVYQESEMEDLIAAAAAEGE
tara:strand:+ start:9676 stop:11472 length:1797 start_codon:yes stop_codon:yes gene_type:complete